MSKKSGFFVIGNGVCKKRENQSFIIVLFALAMIYISSFPSPSPAQEKPQEKALAAFGYDIFRESKEPIVEGPVDDQYILSPGDEVIITVWGQLNLRYPLTVNEEGFLDITEKDAQGEVSQSIRIFTNGVNLKELRSTVTKSFAGIYASYINADNPSQSTAFVDVKLGKVRKLLVYVVGEVKNQGAYTISSGVATLLNLLNNAGGVKETGSLREIKIRRADGKMDGLDLYDFLLTGKIEPKKTQIRSGDYILVPLKAKSVAIRGEVKRTGVYEAIGNEGLKDLIRFAGGLTSNAYLKRAQIRRFEINSGERFIDLDLENVYAAGRPDFVLADGDEVTIFPNVLIRKRLVEIQGSGVKRPGVFQFTPGMRLKDLIEQAEGLREDVYLDRADLVRTNDDFSKKLTIFSLKDLFEEERPGRYKFTGSPDKNFELKELDIVATYSAFEMKGKDKKVTVEGHVKEPGTYVLPDNLTLYDLIFSRGGFQDAEYKQRTYLELAHLFRKKSGETEEMVIPFHLGKLLTGDSQENKKLEAGDRIVVYSYEAMKTIPFVRIEGLVKKPGTYNYADNLTLEDLIMLAGGLTPDAYKVEAVIARSGRKAAEEQGGKIISTITIPVSQDFAVLDLQKKIRLEIFDKILIRNLPEWEPLPVVGVEGQILYPGSYSLEKREERISAVIKMAGGLKKEALAEGAALFRRKGILAMNPAEAETNEKVAINLSEALANPGGPYDLILKDGDRIFIPTNSGVVEVRGAVRNPGNFQYKEGKGLGYYLDLGGGYHKDAEKSGLIVYHPNGIAATKGFLRGPKILPGSIIDVPFRTDAKNIALVEVRGAVKNPMIIQFVKGQRLAYYIGLSGGYQEDADLQNIAIHLPDERILQSPESAFFDPYIEEGCLIEVPFMTLRSGEGALGESGNIIRADRTGLDVEVRGAIWNPGVVRHRRDMKLEYYIGFCGGFKENADVANIVVHYPDGKIAERKGASVFNPDIPAGSIIEIPIKEIEKEEK